ncbi:hypothetical protein C0991_007871 [Blastosporella zonata]|nr:hypothetical protein C0991_007871 [Blastosporella zonata]
MLAANINETPRPRPPAKIRRSSALAQAASTPPPSYAAAFTLTPDGTSRVNSLLGSPMAATFQRVGWDNEHQMSPAREEELEWMHEKSREELSELLVKADDLIKERENELGLASAVCKSLYDNNVMLKTKHQQLLARLPSPSPSPEPISRTSSSSRYSVSLSRPMSEYDSSPVASTSYKHGRKISVSTTEISHLADQNAELLDKLERMEAESLSADQTGRRALKRLEKEILTLREELEKTQAKSEELEKKTKANWRSQKDAQEALRKEERESKFRAMRNLGHADAEDEDEDDQEVRDFAPEGSIFGGPSTGYSFLPPGTTPRRISGTPLKRPPAPFTPHPESTLIAQLLEKIQELEETNGRIIDQQTETTNQLNAMQKETEHISKVYECLTDANFIEVAGETTPDVRGVRTHDETIRFKSFARNLAAEYTSSPTADDTHTSMNLSTVSRMRKSVVGLFDGHDDEIQDRNRGASTPDQLKAFHLPVPFASSPDERHHHKSLSIETSGLASPALSSLGLSPSRNNSQNPRRTLETELGNEFNDGWNLSADKHHLRTNSLYDLSPISVPASPSPSPGHGSFDRSRNIGSPNEPADALPTPMSISAGTTALRLSVEPPTPDKLAAVAKSKTEGSAQSLRHHRMTETLRSRTSRWVDSRFKDTLTGSTKIEFPTDNHHVKNQEPEEEQEAERPSTPLPLRLASAFDAAVEDFIGQPVSRSESGQEVAKASESKVAKKPKGLGAIMLEIWLWLQFAIIILVFLWAMAKRGPKSVLGDTGGHRRTRTISMAR